MVKETKKHYDDSTYIRLFHKDGSSYFINKHSFDLWVSMNKGIFSESLLDQIWNSKLFKN